MMLDSGSLVRGLMERSEGDGESGAIEKDHDERDRDHDDRARPPPLEFPSTGRRKSSNTEEAGEEAGGELVPSTPTKHHLTGPARLPWRHTLVAKVKAPSDRTQ